jgi:hypothetical protein
MALGVSPGKRAGRRLPYQQLRQAGCGTLWYDFTAFPETSAPGTKSVWTAALHPAVPRWFPCHAEAAGPS